MRGVRRRVLRSGGWLPASSPQSPREQVHDCLRRLGLDVLDVVNLRTAAGIDDRLVVLGTLTPSPRRWPNCSSRA
jgi:aryl-alcohol dehydrogenase-like predicted oxidoreductase